MSKKKKARINPYVVAVLLFIAATVWYFFRSNSTMERANTVYTSLDSPKLPILFVEKDGVLFNPMYGQFQEMGSSVARNIVTPLPENRALQILANEYDNMIVSARYEIRSMDMSRLIENGAAELGGRGGGNAHLTIPIQNLIKKDREYVLRIDLDIGEQTLYYYTRILWTDRDYSTELIQLAYSFTLRSFSKTDARNLTIYMESNEGADNSTLAHVDIHSSFKQITFADSGMQREGEVYIYLKQLEGVMGEVQLLYASSCLDAEGNARSFWNEDNFVLRYDPQRIFIMDFDRRTEEQFDASSFRFAGKRLLLGVGGMEDVQILASGSGQFMAYRTDSGLFRYEQSERGGSVSLYTYLSPAEDILRAAYHFHDIKILSVKDNGDVDFILYGYVNRGIHEGYNGILYYTYDNSEDTLIENFFLPLPEDFERLQMDLQKLSYLGENGMLYIFYQGTIFGIDTTSQEIVTGDSGLNDEEIVRSLSGQYIAYQNQKGGDAFYSAKISLMDLSNETSKEIQETGCYFRVIGFMGEDLVYGKIYAGENALNPVQSELPIAEIHIVDASLSEKKSYAQEGIRFVNAEIENGRVHFDKYLYDGENYLFLGYDSIISNKKEEDTQRLGLNSFYDTVMERSWYIEIKDLGERTVHTAQPGNYYIERSPAMGLNRSEVKELGYTFYAYSLGHFSGKSRTLEGAYKLCYEDFGCVKDVHFQTIWNRTDKATSARIKNPMDKLTPYLSGVAGLFDAAEYEEAVLVNATGLDVNSVLYFVGKGYPVLAYDGTSVGEGGYKLISGYDNNSITLTDPASGTASSMPRREAEEYYRARGYPFAAVVER